MVPGRRIGRSLLAASLQQMIDAHALSRLTVPLEAALADPALATCLRNTALASIDAAKTHPPSITYFPLAQADRMRLAAGDRDDYEEESPQTVPAQADKDSHDC
ncbi:hypothetical protein ACFOEY_06590 [Paracandidimonas soli]|uniref:hypothetical protein n=1 Tax=Paracandidimonas soli TaxID=1917182 RepID=UPI00361B8DA0